MSRLFKFGFALLAALTLVACSSTPDDEGAQVEDRTIVSGTDGASTGGASGSGVSGNTVGGGALDPLKDPANVLSKRSVYFGYDSFIIEDQYRPIVEAHARYLVSNPTARMMLQGHTDERGSHEYNIALGQKRADAVKRALVLLGARESQIETVSFGKENPRNPGNDETAWAENRRSDIVYAGE